MVLAGKTALVTGGSRGIGLAIVKELGQMGAVVLATARTAEGVSSINDCLQQSGISGKAYQLDIANRDNIQSVVKEIQADFPPVLILVNNAGITQDNLALAMKEAQWDTVMQVNLTGTFLMIRSFLRGMCKARWGRIISLSSVSASLGSPGQANYCASKAGLEGMTRSLARELAGRSITVNCVAPGGIDTDMMRVLTDQQKECFLSEIPMGRIGSVDEIAYAVGFLAAPRASYITGVVLPVNGGLDV